MYTNILVKEDERIGYITINRTSFLNALNKITINELHDALKDLDNNPTIGVIILTGSGEKAFVAGADIKEFADFDIAQGGGLSADGQAILFDFIENLTTPVIAAVNGFALGGGLELALSCHIRIASENAKLGLPEVSLGLIPGYGGTQRLAQLVGRGKANEMIFTADMITALDALKWGLVNAVVAQSDLIDTCVLLSKRILRNSPTAIAAAIRCVNAGFDNSTDGFEVEKLEFAKCFGTEDFKIGTQAFLNKEKPKFSNR